MPDCESCNLLRELVDAKDALIKALSEKPAPVQVVSPYSPAPLLPSTWQTQPTPPYYVGDPPGTYPGTLTSPNGIRVNPTNVCEAMQI